jgi:hypothetical protein
MSANLGSAIENQIQASTNAWYAAAEPVRARTNFKLD